MRRYWIDRWKGILILLVVLGHVAGGGGNLAEGNVAQCLIEFRRIIYLFHMPAFFILAGLCWKRSRNSSDSFFWATASFAQKRFFRLIIPYFVFGVLSWLAYDAMFRSWGELPAQLGRLLIATDDFRCNSVLWFLPCMFFVLLIGVVIRELPVTGVRLLSIMAIDYIVFFALRYNHIDELPFGFFNVLKYLFWFLFGVLIQDARLPCVRMRWYAGIAIVGFAGFVAIESILHYDTRPFGGFSLWMAEGLVGAMLSAAIAKSLTDKLFKWLEWIGGMSMGIMLVHKFPLVAIQEHVPQIRGLFQSDIGMSLVGVSIVFALSTAISIGATLVIRKVAPWALGETKG